MSDIVYLKQIADLRWVMPDAVSRHPQVAVVDFGRMRGPVHAGSRIICDFYVLMCKSDCANHIRYGRQTHDFQEGSLLCIGPNQLITIGNDPDAGKGASGWGLFFHPELIRGTPLGMAIRQYTFFSYEMSEALHLSEKEKGVLWDCFVKIEQELAENIDEYSRSLIIANIALLLEYCNRFYGRQFITRTQSHKDIVSRFFRVLNDSFETGRQRHDGLPTVKELAEQLHLSPGYLSDLLRKETGMHAQDHIHHMLIEEAKNILRNSEATVGEIAYSLGFEYPQYFSKLFRKKTGVSPLAYRNLQN